MKNLIILVFTFCTLAAFGQNSGNTIERKGFVIGFGVGSGVISIANSNDDKPFDEAQVGINFPSLKLGWMVSDRMAVLASFPGMIYDSDGKDRSFDAFLPSVQYWASDRWWLNGGIGLAMDIPAFYEADDFLDEPWNYGCAVAISTGFELVQKKKFALDLQTKLHMGRVYLEEDGHRDGVAFSIGLGFNWY